MTKFVFETVSSTNGVETGTERNDKEGRKKEAALVVVETGTGYQGSEDRWHTARESKGPVLVTGCKGRSDEQHRGRLACRGSKGRSPARGRRRAYAEAGGGIRGFPTDCKLGFGQVELQVLGAFSKLIFFRRHLEMFPFPDSSWVEIKTRKLVTNGLMEAVL